MANKNGQKPGAHVGKQGQPTTNMNSKNARRNARRREARRMSRQGISAPIAKGFRALNSGAMVSGSGDVVRVRHREYVADVIGSTSFATTVFKINPGLVTSFPWLSNLAANFEKYRFRSLRFAFESSVATTAAGSVMLGIDLDALDVAPGTKAQMLQMQNVVRSNVWDNSVSTIPEGVPELFVRTGNVPTGADAKTYDAGQLVIGRVGTADSTSVIGEVWFEYDVELHTPQSTQAPVLSASGSAPSGLWTGVTFAGDLRVEVVSGASLRIYGFSGITYQITHVSTGAGPGASGVIDAITLYNNMVTQGTNTIEVLIVRGAGVFTLNLGTADPQQLLITPVEPFPGSV